MAEYIEKEKIIEKIGNTPFRLNCTGKTEDYKKGALRGLVAKKHNVIDMIKEQPSAYVAPVVHGRWVERMFGTHECSACHKDPNHYDGVTGYAEFLSDFCPNCGAKMDGAENE